MSLTAAEFQRASQYGAAARRGGQSAETNPWRHASTERDRTLRDAWADAWHDEDSRRAK